jgi:hypothetical protein
MMAQQGWLAAVHWPRPAPQWQDKSMLGYAGHATPGSAVPPNMMLARDERVGPDDSADEALPAYAERQRQLMAQRLPEFAVERQGPLSLGGLEAQELLFRWQAGAHRLAQWVVWIGLPDHSVLCFTATCDAVQLAQHQGVFEAALQNLKVQPARMPPRVVR